MRDPTINLSQTKSLRQMEIVIRPTKVLTRVEGSLCRIWEGRLPSGLPCRVYVSMLTVVNNQDFEVFSLELQMRLTPPEAGEVPLDRCLWV